MVYIAHRGNTEGPNPKMENSPVYIDAAISEGYQVEVDVWGFGMELRLGHDVGEYVVPFDYLIDRIQHLWVHCKNAHALYLIRTYAPQIRYFWHQTDDYTLTSWHDIWCYPGKDPVGTHSIVVMPELTMPFDMILPYYEAYEVAGICSDHVKSFRYK